MNKTSIAAIIIIVLAAAAGGYFLLSGHKTTPASTIQNGNTGNQTPSNNQSLGSQMPPMSQTPGTLPSSSLPPTTPPTTIPPSTTPPRTTPPPATPPPAPQPVSITIQNFAFSPGSATIKAGTKVTWTNQDSVPHQIASDNSSAVSFLSNPLSTGQSFSFTFTTSGTFPYHCAIHPFMTSTIIVTQ